MRSGQYRASGGMSEWFRTAEAAARIEVHDEHFAFGWSTECAPAEAIEAGLSWLGDIASTGWSVTVSNRAPALNGEVDDLLKGRSESLIRYLTRNADELKSVNLSARGSSIAWRRRTPDNTALPTLYVSGDRYDPDQVAHLFKDTAADALNDDENRADVLTSATSLLGAFIV